jgi:hypothetical protein
VCRAVPPAGVEPAPSRLRAGRHDRSTTGARRSEALESNQALLDISEPCLHGHRPPTWTSQLRRQDSNLRLTINSRASCRSTTPERKERESNPQGPAGPPVFETGYRTDGSPSKVAPAGFEPALHRLRVGSSGRLSYGAEDVAGRIRTCGAPRFRRPLYRLSYGHMLMGDGGNLARCANQVRTERLA